MIAGASHDHANRSGLFDAVSMPVDQEFPSMTSAGSAPLPHSMPIVHRQGAARHCTACGNRIEPEFQFCGECGAELRCMPAQDESPPVPAPPDPQNAHVVAPLAIQPPDSSTRGRRRTSRRRKPLYRRPLFIVPIVLLGILLVGASVVAYRMMSAFESVQSVSTPPPEVSGVVLGGDEDLVIDTGPAQRAVREQQEQESGSSVDPGQNAESTESATTQDDTTLVAPSTPPVAADADGINILLMGVDARDAESIDIGVRPDSLGVLNLNEETGSCRILALPRDSRVDLPGYGQSKVNHALAVGGIPYEVLVVEEYLDIEIEHYALVDFAGLVQVVDAVDGVTVDNPEAFDFGDTTFAAGSIHLEGEDALTYARYRGGSEGDFGRIGRQQQVIRGLMDQVYDINLVKLVPNMFSLLSDNFRTDYGATDLVGLADAYRTSCTSTTMETRTIPGDVEMAFDDLMQIDLSFVISDPATVRDNVDWLLGLTN
jgi:LCP family protein required for cell wall assembly